MPHPVFPLTVRLLRLRNHHVVVSFVRKIKASERTRSRKGTRAQIPPSPSDAEALDIDSEEDLQIDETPRRERRNLVLRKRLSSMWPRSTFGTESPQAVSVPDWPISILSLGKP